MSNDEEKFEQLKTHFGSEDDADQISFEGYALLLSNEDVNSLILRVKNDKIKEELLEIRKRANVSQSQQAGKMYDVQHNYNLFFGVPLLPTK